MLTSVLFTMNITKKYKEENKLKAVSTSVGTAFFFGLKMSSFFKCGTALLEIFTGHSFYAGGRR